MAKKRTEPTPKEAARVAAPKPAEPCCYEGKGCCLDEARDALAKAATLADVAAVLYGLPPADRGKLHDEVVVARDRALGVK
jgi:hypothetical protein